MLGFMKERNTLFASLFAVLTIFVTRFDIAKGLIMNGFLFLLCVCFFSLKYKNFATLTTEMKECLKAFMVFIMSAIPSILFSDKVLISGLTFCFNLAKYGVFLTIILFIRQRKYLVWMLTVYFIFNGVDCLTTLVQLMTGNARGNRGYGFGGMLLAIADIMCMLLPIALTVIMDSRFEKKLKGPAIFTSIAIIIGLLCNKSRGAWLTELIVVPIAVFRYLKQNRKYLVAFLIIILGLVGFVVSNPNYVHRIRSITNFTTDHSNADRIWVWKSAKLMIQDYPITGVGYGRFHDIYEKGYKFEQETQNLPHTHNNFIQVAVECGVIGTAGFLYLVWFFLSTSLHNFRKKNNPYDLLIFTTFFAHICVFGQIENTLNPAVHPIFLFLLAILLRLKETGKHSAGSL